MPSPRWWRPTGGGSIASDTNSPTSAGSSSANRAASSSTSSRFATARGFVGRIWIEDRDYNLVRFNGASRGFGRDVVRPAQAEAVVPYGRLACERGARRVGAVVRLLGRNGSEQRFVVQVVLQVEAASPVQEPDTDLGIPGAKHRPDRLVDDDPDRRAQCRRHHRRGRAAVARAQPAPMGTGGRGERPRKTRGDRPARAGGRSGQGPRDRPQQPRRHQQR